MSEPDEAAQAKAFLRDLIDEYGVEGLTDRLRSAIEEAEAGRVAGPGIDDATSWIEASHGEAIKTSFAGEGHMSIFAGPAGGPGHPRFAGEGHLTIVAGAALAANASITAEGVVEKFATDLATATDAASVSIIETAEVVASTITHIPTNIQVLTQLEHTFWYLINAWSLLQVPIEVIPFALLLALAIVVIRIRIKQTGE